MRRILFWAGLIVAASIAALVLIPIPIVNLKIELPKTVAAPVECNPVKLLVSAVNGRTDIKLEYEPVELANIVAKIEKISNGCPSVSTPIYIFANSTTKFGELTAITNRLKSAGYTKLYLIRID